MRLLKRLLGGKLGGREDSAPRLDQLSEAEIAFVICVEANRIEPQARLLCEKENLRPLAGTDLNVFASTGPVGREASEWWGSSQAALSIAIWSTTPDIYTYDERYNIPLNNLTGPGQSWPLRQGSKPVLLHYHHLAEPQYHAQLRQALQRIRYSSDVLKWIEERLPLFNHTSL